MVVSVTKPLPEVPDRLRLEKLERLLEVAKAMASQRDVKALMDIVLEEAKAVAEAERGTVWLLDRDRKELRTFVAQGLAAAKSELRMPEDRGIAGAVAKGGRTIRVHDAYADSRFDRSQDEQTGFRTRNILAVPMWAVDQTVFGVLQLLNKKENVDGGHFTDVDQELLTAFGSQAAAALQSALLYEENRRAFEGFIDASVIAIEARDPTTSGHSGRVAQLTVGLAEVVNRLGVRTQWDPGEDGFDEDEILEIQYAAPLHDFGKIGVREEVLVKADKLYPHERDLLLHRLEYVRRTMESDMWRRKFDLASSAGSAAAGAALAEEEARYRRELVELAELQEFVLACNRPTVLEEGHFERLREVQKRV